MTFPQGFFSLVVEGLTLGQEVAVTMILHAGPTPNTFYKFGPEPTDTSDHWYEFLDDGTSGAELADNVVTLFFVDGERGDTDLSADGRITDPGGPGVADLSGDVAEPPLDGAETVDAGPDVDDDAETPATLVTAALTRTRTTTRTTMAAARPTRRTGADVPRHPLLATRRG